jgi:hypothetical protein
LPDEIPQALTDLVFAGLDHGIDSVRDGGPLVPFVMTESGTDRIMTRFASESLEDGISKAVEHVQAKRGEPGTRCVLVYDGYLTLPSGEKHDAIFAEGVEPGKGGVVVIAQRYRPKRALRRFETIGNPALIPGAPGKLGP